MIGRPVVESLGSRVQRRAHGCSPPGFGAQPHPELPGYFHQAARAIVFLTCLSSTVAASATWLMARKGSSGEVPGRAVCTSGFPFSSVVYVMTRRGSSRERPCPVSSVGRWRRGCGLRHRPPWSIFRCPGCPPSAPDMEADWSIQEEEAARVVSADIRRVWHVATSLAGLENPIVCCLQNERLQGGVENRAFPRSRGPAWRSKPLMGAGPGDIMCVGSQRAARASYKQGIQAGGWQQYDLHNR